ncbi:FxsA family protein [Helicobacter apodemus]|uniref:FxsA family protein n=1 Tax=Helicobacter apodemus TaxID=135569 RepID=A0A4U8UI75_9HELI|nr:FxsA family protein [Helicobacter apodemus]TLE16969.1 FxsA family protein [Helicobacter apodemus]
MPLILILLYIFLEILLSYALIEWIGVFGFFLEVVITALLGLGLLVNFRIFFKEVLGKFYLREISQEVFFSSNVFRILGAILLILPGALSDILGIFMQFSITLMLLKPFSKTKASSKDSEIIDVEVIEKD